MNEKRKFSFLAEDNESSNESKIVSTDNKNSKKKHQSQRTNINFWKTGIRKYQLILNGEMQLNSMNVTNKVESNMILHIKSIYDTGGILLNLINYDKEMTECSNQGFKELFMVTRQFEKLYDEFEITVSPEGIVTQIKNLDFLKEKWKKIKNEAVQYFNEDTDIESFFRLNDQTMNDQKFWMDMLNQQEFFFLFFNLANYGNDFYHKKTINRNNAYQSNIIPWNIFYEGKAYEDHIVLNVNGHYNPDNDWLNKAYGKMPFLTDISFLPNFNIKGQYKIETETGFIKEAWINLEEVASPGFLFHKLKFEIKQIP